MEVMERWVPKELIDSWDNTGFQVGNPNKEINRILIALDLDKNVLNKALDENFQMIITHHPIIFKPLKTITTLDNNVGIIIEAIKNEIVVYNAHTNLDLVEGGVNDRLAEILGLKDTIPLSFAYNGNLAKKIGYGRVGYINRIGFYNYLNKIKNNLSVSNLIVYGGEKDYIEKVAICGGSGSDFILDAYRHGADIYITSDIKYHDAQLGHGLGLSIVDAGHFNTEKIILPCIKTYLQRELENNIEIEVLMESSLPQFIY